jgi:hypothetical protein
VRIPRWGCPKSRAKRSYTAIYCAKVIASPLQVAVLNCNDSLLGQPQIWDITTEVPNAPHSVCAWARYNTGMTVEFSPAHHALLFAWVAREVLARTEDERGEAILRQAVRRYGEQRGSRMAQRAQRDGQPVDMTAYLAYAEWQAAPELFETSRQPVPGGASSHVFRCPWQQAWLDNGVSAAGRLYCLEIDEALGRGFGLSENLLVTGTLSNGEARCEFIYPGADLERLQDMPVDPSRRVMPWVYHLGHLFAVLRSVLATELGEAGTAALQAGLEQFRAQFGEDAAQQMLEAAGGDFNTV